MGKDEFEKRYLKNWASLEVISPNVKVDSKEISFSFEEISHIKQDIVLHWIYCGVKGSLNHPQAFDIVRYASINKYGYGNDRSEILAASTLGMDISDYRNFLSAREEFERRL